MRRLFPRLADALFGDAPASDVSNAEGGASGGSSRREASRQGSGPRSQQQLGPTNHLAGADESNEPSGRSVGVTIDDLRARSPLFREMPGYDGGLQGMPSISLRCDEDGDEAHEFIVIDTPPPQPNSSFAKQESS
mmetsp:Transcript_54786/g.108790  ORF Transcript_54786/g.108790 Transcript_54786/m.108790 type:complete len:135 (-) Transcript_54786:328-732(-)|eukprot:CAMPEP_0174717214 /NCGR_PEP_ID=MMETSP1094-20130205/26195_1 /TAXON_ID=156173 /ORGANISM="Chrysochromulina brevifilum, Strain UTEX LB 985" /LENGTH=134 /DNA_ID=CAMNT_0015917119 /DNA_START=111 /DNA_END=515 /DNA_ORIENTATION=-